MSVFRVIAPGRVVARVLAAAAIPLSAFAAGCGAGGFTTAPVSGRVTVDGEPVAGLRVSFEPVGGKDRPLPGPDSVAVTDEDGRYSLVTTDEGQGGAVVGPCRVRVWTILPAMGEPPTSFPNPVELAAVEAGASNGGVVGDEPPHHLPGVPLRFNEQTQLSFDVPPGGTKKADFAISWR
jgi:hypothetical protein